jgi:hypothetical protein
MSGDRHREPGKRAYRFGDLPGEAIAPAFIHIFNDKIDVAHRHCPGRGKVKVVMRERAAEQRPDLRCRRQHGFPHYGREIRTPQAVIFAVRRGRRNVQLTPVSFVYHEDYRATRESPCPLGHFGVVAVRIGNLVGVVICQIMMDAVTSSGSQSCLLIEIPRLNPCARAPRPLGRRRAARRPGSHHGAFGDDVLWLAPRDPEVVPHLTIGHGHRLDDLRAAQDAVPGLPIGGYATAVALLTQLSTGHWIKAATFTLV